MQRKSVIQSLIGLAALFLTPWAMAAPVGTAFTYQGQLKNTGSPVNGNTNMAFSLWDAASGGTQQGSTLTFTGGTTVNVTNGLFTVQLDFGVNPYADNQARWLEITVNGTTLAPRQPLTPTPFALNMRGINVDASGKVGIGTTTPLEALHVAGGIGQCAGDVMAVRNPGGDQDIWMWPRWTDGRMITNFGTEGWDIRNNSSVSVMRLQPNGNVGIGTTDPSNKLSVFGNADVSGNVGIGTVNPISALDVRGSGGILTNNAFGFSAPSSGPVPTDTYMSSPGGGTIAFTTTSVERMRIDNNGNVGIGTTSPANNLSVVGNADVSGNVGIGTTSPTSPLSFRNFDERKITYFESAAPNGFYGVDMAAGGNVRTWVGQFGKFLVGHDNGAGGFTERMRVNDNGNVGIGTTSPASKLDVRGDIKLGSSGQYFAVGGGENLRIIRGIVDNNGNGVSGSGYSVVRNSTGIYTVTFSSGFSDNPAVLVTAFGGGAPRIANTSFINPTTTTVAIWTTGGAPADALFSFTAIGPK